MNFEAFTRDKRIYQSSILIGAESMEEGKVRRNPLVKTKRPQMHRTKSFSSNYFSVESFLVLLCLTVSLLILPLILPPLSPPPVMFLLLPIGIMAVLLVFAFMPSDIRIASSYL